MMTERDLPDRRHHCPHRAGIRAVRGYAGGGVKSKSVLLGVGDVTLLLVIICLTFVIVLNKVPYVCKCAKRTNRNNSHIPSPRGRGWKAISPPSGSEIPSTRGIREGIYNISECDNHLLL